MWISKDEITRLSDNIRKIIDGENIDFRDNKEGVWSLLKNDIYTLSTMKSEQADSFQKERNTMNDMLTDISHQLKTPITSLLIMSDLLESLPMERQTEFTRNIKMGILQMDWLVANILKLAKLDSKVVEFVKKKIDIQYLIELSIEPLQILLDIKNQEIEIIKSNLELYCDIKWTAEALTNVIKNALEYSPNNSKVIIDAGENPICQWISVTDSGKGISFNNMGNLFKRFEGSRSEKGYGIGLPLALSIMKGQNGDIDVDGGRNGVGATFKLKLYK